jgi:valyl-tRNA synthetase
MKAVELEKSYNPKDFEDRIYEESGRKAGCSDPRKGWEAVYDRNASTERNRNPPHGHALNNSLPDIVIRYWRMHGRPTLWVPGTDHAGIATQNVVERPLANEGLRRQDLGREKFVERTWHVKEKHHDIIARQLEKIGCSCDWDHERFTMDEGLSRAVRNLSSPCMSVASSQGKLSGELLSEVRNRSGGRRGRIQGAAWKALRCALSV